MKHVFISSTFKDMQFERDALHTIACANINEKLAPYGEEVYFGDLRWGVNTTSLDSDEGCRRVLEVCFDEIDDCRPYMIVLVGERYGWMPDAALIRDAAAKKGIDVSDGMSVTELEIEYGALFNKSETERVFFYFRELDTTEMSDEERADYLAENEESAARIAALKRRIVELYPGSVRTYAAKYDKESGRIEGLEGFLRKVEEDLSLSFLSDIRGEEDFPWQERAMRSAERYLLEISQNYYPAEREPLTLFDGTFCNTQTRMNFIKGEAGTGKSVFLAHNFREVLAGGESCALPFVLGLDKYSSCEMDYFKILLYKLEELTDSEHMYTSYGESEYDEAVFERIREIESYSGEIIHSFIDNCSYELQNELSVRLLDDYLREPSVEYFGSSVNLHDSFEFTVAYSSNEEAVILPPWFDFSRTYVLSSIFDGDRVPLMKTLLRQKHKELDDSVISAIAEKEDASSVFYLKLALDRMLMLDSDDFAKIRKMGDGMENINRYQLSVVKALPETTHALAEELIKRVAARTNYALVMRLLGLLTYGGIRMYEKFIESVFLTAGWEYSSLDFALATRSLSSVINYNPKDKSYAVTNPAVIDAVLELLDEEGYSYVARALCDHIASVGGAVMTDALLHAASYVGVDYLSDVYMNVIDERRSLEKETDWLIRQRGAEFAADVLMSLVRKHPERDFSFALLGLPVACLMYDDREPCEELLKTIVDNYGELSENDEDINRNSFAVIAWTKLVTMKMNVNTSDASAIFHSFIDSGYRFYPMTPRARIRLDIVYYKYLANEAFYSMNIVVPESEVPIADSLVEELESAEERLLLHSHLLGAFAAYLQRGYDSAYSEYLDFAKRGYEILSKYLGQGACEYFTADDVAMMIDSVLEDKEDGSLSADRESVALAIRYMTIGKTKVNPRLAKYLPRILVSSKYTLDEDESCDFTEETVRLLQRLCATSRAVAGSAMTVDDCLFAIVQMEHSFDIITDSAPADVFISLLGHFNKFVNLTLSIAEGDQKVFYRTYLSLRKLLTVFDIYDCHDARRSMLARISSLEYEDADAPLLPELFKGALMYYFAEPENEDLRLYLRGILDTVDTDPEYQRYLSSYAPELLYLRLDLRSAEEIAKDDEENASFFSFADEDSLSEYETDFDDEDFDPMEDDEDFDEEFDPTGLSEEEMLKMIQGMGLSIEDLLSDDEE